MSRSTTAWRLADIAELDAALSGAEMHGIDASDALRTLQVAAATKDHGALSVIAVTFASALAHGLVNPAAALPIYTVARNNIDVEAGLRRALRSGTLSAWLAGLAPQDEGYASLSAAYCAASREILNPSSVIVDQSDGGGDPPAFVRARILVLNLERRRWLVRDPPSRRIDVNIPNASLIYRDADDGTWSSRVIVGRDDDQTPDLQAEFTKLVVNPPWHVPRSIIRTEFKSKPRDYFRREHMHWTQDGLVQSPGPWAALGAVKFDLNDPYAIYLHGTPAKSLFEDSERDLSHGCVRMQNAVEFARVLAMEDGKGDQFAAALTSGATRAIALRNPVTVRLLYHTAFVDPASGAIAYRDDIYGRDSELADALAMVGISSPQRI